MFLNSRKSTKMKGFSSRNLWRMQKFYHEYKNYEKLPEAMAELSWTSNYMLIERIKDVLLELGKGFSFVGSEYKISTPDNDYYIDLLFYHINLKCYIVVELKNTDFKPEYVGQINFYVTAVDKTLKDKADSPTLGLLLCRNKDRVSVEWALERVDSPIGVSSYKIQNKLTEQIKDKLPSEEELEKEINLHLNLDSKNDK